MKVYIYLFSYNSFVCFFFCIPNRISYKSLELQWANICTLSLKLQYLWSKVKVYCCLHILICITIYFHKFFIFKCVSIIQLNVHLNFWIIYRVLDFNISLDMQESPSNNDKISISIQTVETKRRNHLSEGFQFEHKFVYIFFQITLDTFIDCFPCEFVFTAANFNNQKEMLVIHFWWRYHAKNQFKNYDKAEK